MHRTTPVLRKAVRRVLLAGLTSGVVGAACLAGGVSSASTSTAQVAAATASGSAPQSAAVTVRAPLSGDVRQAMTKRRLTATSALREYWTPQRMRTAIPLDATGKRTPGAAPSTSAVAGPARSVAPAAPTTAGVLAQRKAAGSPVGKGDVSAAVAATATVGKVFFRNATDGLNYVCSAGTVNSNSKRLISTAGHCVHGGSGGTWHQNWTFVPYYNYGNRPYGTWSANWLVSFNGWINNSNFDYDVGFVKAFDLNGQQIVNAVGGNGIQTGQATSRPMTILGYPSESPYPGDWQYYCTGTTSASGSRISMPCPLTRGVSGGPWLYAYSDSTGLGYINGTCSTTNSGRTTLWSPYFSSSVWDLYNYADGL